MKRNLVYMVRMVQGIIPGMIYEKNLKSFQSECKKASRVWYGVL